jgi:hypothetical protein
MSDIEAARYLVEILESHKAYFKTETYRMREYMERKGLLKAYDAWKLEEL